MTQESYAEVLLEFLEALVMNAVRTRCQQTFLELGVETMTHRVPVVTMGQDQVSQ